MSLGCYLLVTVACLMEKCACRSSINETDTPGGVSSRGLRDVALENAATVGLLPISGRKRAETCQHIYMHTNDHGGI